MVKSIALVMMVLAMVACTVSFAGASPPAWLDITATPAGQHMAAQAIQRFQEHGWYPPSVDVPGLATKYKVIQFGDEDLVIGSRVKVTFQYVDGKLEPLISTFCESAGGDPPTTAKTTAAAFTVQAYDANGDHYISQAETYAAINDYYDGYITQSQALQVVNAYYSEEPIPDYWTGGPAWMMIDQGYFSRTPNYDNPTGWMDSRYKTYKLMYDRDPSLDFYTLNFSGTAMSKSVFRLHAAAVRSVASPASATQQWVDWYPGGDVRDPNCRTLTMSVSAGGFSIGTSTQYCPTWTVNKNIPPGDFGVCWNGSIGSGGAREVGYEICISVAQNHWPIWDLTPSFNASVLY